MLFRAEQETKDQKDADFPDRWRACSAKAGKLNCTEQTRSASSREEWAKTGRTQGVGAQSGKGVTRPRTSAVKQADTRPVLLCNVNGCIEHSAWSDQNEKEVKYKQA